jgi:molecular chaperone GrpE
MAENAEKDKTEETTENTIQEETTVAESQNSEEQVEETIEMDPLEKTQLELAEMKDKYIRLYSEFDNYRKRTAKEKIDTVINATEGLIKDLLPVVDDFERAKIAAEKSEDIEAVKEGISLIFNKINHILTTKGLKPMESKGQIFNVDLHECITQFAAGDEQKGLVIDEVEKGYFLNDKVIRFAKVVVGN